VKKLVDEILPAGNHTILWNGKDENGKPVSSGVYFYKMKCSNYSFTKKMILLK
jgi:flagellar hook assembly protein FlgD